MFVLIYLLCSAMADAIVYNPELAPRMELDLVADRLVQIDFGYGEDGYCMSGCVLIEGHYGACESESDVDFDSADAVEREAAAIWDEPILRDRGNHHHGCSHKRTNGTKPRFKF